MRHLIGALLCAFCLSMPCGAQDGDEHDSHQPFGGTQSNSDYFLERSDAAFHLGDYEHAVLLHRARVAIDPEAVDSYSVGAWLLWSMGRGNEAKEFVERGLKANPNSWEMWDEAGQQFDLQKDSARAAKSYQRAVELLPPDEPSQMLRRRLAHAVEKTGDYQTALQTWRALVRDFPEDVNKNNLRRVESLVAQKSGQGSSVTKAR